MTDVVMPNLRDYTEGEEFIADVEGVVNEDLLEEILSEQEISGVLTDQQLAEIGSRVVEDWQKDRDDNKDWRNGVEKALKAAAQENDGTKTWPWPNAANVKYPLLTISSLQFAARAYPALVKGDEAILVKTFGKDPNGEKKARAERLKSFLNYVLFYKVSDWEGDTDSLLNQLPSTGTCFRKVHYDPLEGKYCIRLVPALRLTVPIDAKTLDESPRITEDFDQFPNDIARMKKAGLYRDVTLVDTKDEEQCSRVILEQHRLMDLDEDGIDEPYIVTVDEQTAQVLRIERAFDEEDILTNEAGDPLLIKRWQPYVKYAFLRDPKGRFYELGFGQLLSSITEVINSIINQSLDAGAAQAAGGGFIGAELRLQGAGQNGRLLFEPGKFKTVNANGGDIAKAIYERTFPGPSPVLFQMLGMLMEAAKDVASVNDAITGDAARTAPVGTTLALIEQGQQVFNAIFKRFYRGARTEYQKFVECLRRWGGEEIEAMYKEFLDDPEVSFYADADEAGIDIRPVADPGAVTQQQKIAKAQMILGLVPTQQINPKVAVRQTLDAINADDIEALMTMEQQQPPPGTLEMMAMKLAEAEAKVALMTAQKGETDARTQKTLTEAARAGMEAESGQVQADVAATKAKADKDRAAAFTEVAQAFGEAAGIIQQ